MSSDEPSQDLSTEPNADNNAPVPLIKPSARSETVQRREPNPVVGVAIQQTSFSGPLPPPDMLVQYEQIFPGAAERFFDHFENQAAHRMQIETSVVNGNIRAQHQGQLFALIAVSLGFGLSGYMAFWDLVRLHLPPC